MAGPCSHDRRPRMNHLVVLLGNKNSPTGQLSAIARSRCDAAISCLKGDRAAFVLPTGGFGAGFNVTDTPHGCYLAKYLKDHGIATKRILPHVNSSGTDEDALMVRRMVLEKGFQRITVVTSGFHARRARYVFGRVLAHQDVKILEVDSPISPAELQKLEARERRYLAKTQANWIDVADHDAEQPFPTETYTNADREQKHYDSVSLALVTGMVGVFAYVTAIQRSSTAPLGRTAAYLIGAFLIMALYVMYHRCSLVARTARRIMRVAELASGQIGFSANYWRQGIPRRRPSIKQVVTGLAAFMSLLLVGAAICEVAGLALQVFFVVMLVI
jgi:hypothetical protein